MSDSAPSIRALLGPIVEVNRRLDSLLDIQWRLMELRNSLETFHPDMSELLHQSTPAHYPDVAHRAVDAAPDISTDSSALRSGPRSMAHS